MSEGLVPAVTRPPAARTGSAAMALPAVIVDAGPVAVERFLEFFAASIANRRTRAAYGRAVGQFLSWCASRGLSLRAIAPLHVAAYIRTHPGVGADGETAPGRHPGTVRLAGHPPGAAGESGRGGAGTEARGDQIPHLARSSASAQWNCWPATSSVSSSWIGQTSEGGKQHGCACSIDRKRGRDHVSGRQRTLQAGSDGG